MSSAGASLEATKVALYLRVSSDEQRERESIKTQREFFDQYTKLYGVEVVEVYADDGVSGTIPLHERPEGRRLIGDAQAGKFETLLVYRLDRLGRSLLVIVDAHDRLQTGGVSLRSATEPIDTSNPSGRLIFPMLASFAEYERESIADRTRGGLHRAYRNGKHLGRIPYGYCLALTSDTNLVIVEEEAKVVREIIANVADGSTLYREARRLNTLGIPSPGWRFKNGERKHGTSWFPTTIAAIVHQSAYSGVHKIKIDNGETIERPVPPVVPPGLRGRAEAALEENKRRRGAGHRGDDRKYLLSGLVKCAECGLACTGRTTTSTYKGAAKKYSYYGCVANRADREVRAAPHFAPHAPAPWLEDLVWSDVRTFLENPGEVLDRVREQQKDERDDANPEGLGVRHEDLSKRLAAKQSEKDRYVRLYAGGHLSEEELETYLSDLKNQIGNLRLLIDATEADMAHSRERAELADTTLAWLTRLKDRIAEVEEDTPEAFSARQKIVKLLVSGVELEKAHKGDPLRVRVTYRFDPPSAEGDGEEGFVGDEQNPPEITHEKNLVDSKDAAGYFVRTMQGLDDRLGPLLLQLPPDFTVEGIDVLDAFLAELPKGPSYAVEVRHRSWLDSDLSGLLREHGAALTLVDYPRISPTSAGSGIAASSLLGTPAPKRTGPKICAGGPAL